LTQLNLIHGEGDRAFAVALSAYLERGCNVAVELTQTSRIIETVDQIADLTVLLLSPSSWPKKEPRETWEPLLQNPNLATFLLSDCPAPPLLRRRNFFDATTDPQTAKRLLKRWLWQREHRATHSLNTHFSPDLQDLYAALSDESGTLRATGDEAARFFKEAGQEFEAALWIPAYNRTLAQVAGDLGVQLGLTLEGPVDQNVRRILDLLSTRRCLVVLDAPEPDVAPELVSPGRTSTLVTRDPVQVLETPTTMPQARKLLAARRYAEAYELLYRLLDTGVVAADCAHELSWICDHWNRPGESESLRYHYRLPPTEQLSLF
jgi:hypothetical protein